MQGDDACENAFGLGWIDFPYRPAWRPCAGTAAGHGTLQRRQRRAPRVGSPGAWLDVGILSGGDSCTARGYFDLYARVDRISGFALSAGLVVQPKPSPAHGWSDAPSPARSSAACTGAARGDPAHFSVRWDASRRALGRSARERGHPSAQRTRDARSGVSCAVTAANTRRARHRGRDTAATPPSAS